VSPLAGGAGPRRVGPRAAFLPAHGRRAAAPHQPGPNAARVAAAAGGGAAGLRAHAGVRGAGALAPTSLSVLDYRGTANKDTGGQGFTFKGLDGETWANLNGVQDLVDFMLFVSCNAMNLLGAEKLDEIM
jgi:hypothetical protein